MDADEVGDLAVTPVGALDTACSAESPLARVCEPAAGRMVEAASIRGSERGPGPLTDVIMRVMLYG